MLRFPARIRARATVHLTALIDIIFLLLIYFLLTSNFVTQEGIDVNLPQMTAEQSTTDQRITVVVNRQGIFFINDRQMDAKALSFYLQSVIGKAENDTVVIKADQDVVYERVVAAMDIAKQAGAAHLLLATQRRAGKK